LLTVADAAQNKKHAREPAAPAADQSEPPAKRTRTAKGQAAKGRTAKGKAPAHGDGQATSPSPPEGPTSQSLPEDDDEDNVDPVFAVDVLDAEEPETTTPNMIVKPIAENGLTRIGPQPRQSHAEDIRSAPREIIESRLNLFLRIVFKSTDKALGSRRETLDDVGSELLRSLVQHGESSVKRPCDYTGFDIVFTPGPRSMSVEAVYPYVYADDKLAYHAHPNVHIIMTFLNWLKGKHAIITLPLLAAFLAVPATPGFERQKAKSTWLYNALCNAATLERIFGLTTKSHALQIEMWSSWDRSKQEAVLEALRTGTSTRVLEQELPSWSNRKLFTVGVSGQGLVDAKWAGIYDNLLSVAAAYGLTPHEFEYYCTVSSPTDTQARVFYPFHVLSRPQAEASGWDWGVLGGFAHTRLHRLRTHCNKHAEEAGCGEPGMDALRVVYWMAHQMCNTIRRVKGERPAATQEEVAFNILDRWGLPVVPWDINMLSASFAKDQDHGIAMHFGLVQPDDEEFDPVKHFDLSRCTIRMDTRATNMAMRDFSTDS
jgi:hypothetical protein